MNNFTSSYALKFHKTLDKIENISVAQPCGRYLRFNLRKGAENRRHVIKKGPLWPCASFDKNLPQMVTTIFYRKLSKGVNINQLG